MEKPKIGISIGDINGIGIETIIKVFSDARMLDYCIPIIFASNKVINFYKKSLSEYPLNYISIKKMDMLNTKQVNVYSCWEEDVLIEPGKLNDVGGKYAVRSLEVATQCLADGEIDAMVTAPIHKKNTQSPQFNFTGHTPFLKSKFQANDVVMMLYWENFRVALATEHVPIQKVSASLSTQLIIEKTKILRKSLIEDFGIDQPKIAILGLNPHAGDNGLLGNEEETIIIPAIEKLKEQGILAFGPYSADGYFANLQYQKFDATLAMYHDQGLIPFKYIAGMNGVNYTCGLPVIRTSPDHGVGFDIAGQNKADENSLREAVFESISIFRQRKEYQKNTSNPLEKKIVPKER